VGRSWQQGAGNPLRKYGMDAALSIAAGFLILKAASWAKMGT
jgi:hypothetical protein